MDLSTPSRAWLLIIGPSGLLSAIPMIIEEITVTAFQQHTRILGCEKTKRAICIDPGDDSKAIVEAIDKHGFELQAIAVTHAHLDHIGGVAALKKLKPAAADHASQGRRVYL